MGVGGRAGGRGVRGGGRGLRREGLLRGGGGRVVGGGCVGRGGVLVPGVRRAGGTGGVGRLLGRCRLGGRGAVVGVCAGVGVGVGVGVVAVVLIPGGGRLHLGPGRLRPLALLGLLLRGGGQGLDPLGGGGEIGELPLEGGRRELHGGPALEVTVVLVPGDRSHGLRSDRSHGLRGGRSRGLGRGRPGLRRGHRLGRLLGLHRLRRLCCLRLLLRLEPRRERHTGRRNGRGRHVGPLGQRRMRCRWSGRPRRERHPGRVRQGRSGLRGLRGLRGRCERRRLERSRSRRRRGSGRRCGRRHGGLSAPGTGLGPRPGGRLPRGRLCRRVRTAPGTGVPGGVLRVPRRWRVIDGELARHLDAGLRVGLVIAGCGPAPADPVPIAAHNSSWCGRPLSCRAGATMCRSYRPKCCEARQFRAVRHAVHRLSPGTRTTSPRVLAARPVPA